MRFGIVGDDSVATAVRAAGASVEPEPADADAVVAVGESALSAVALGAEWSCPVVPVDCAAPWSPKRHELESRLSAFVAGGGRVVDHPTLSVGEDSSARALFDAMLVTSEPAHISEYGVAHAETAVPFSTDPTDESRAAARWTPVDEFRADGVVVATPLGSSGYARAAGGAVVGPAAGLAVVPVSPYATQTNSWVLQPPVRLSVERDDAPVSLVADDEVVREIRPFESVVIDRDGSVPVLVE
ncbi:MULTISPECIES: NAD(+)/NADH kinase [Haloferax]|uniref:Inorganic polyphosphate/ATP-NAD kinase n=1 Tax=Haloferax massiliensis TaxID=1476858 RepID=A0A0D6JSU6_9EURY|nr:MULTISPECIES: NAD(+)/NADH kinase [Haloferax]MDS0240558.1 NAD(+)/NADH kinase [Haloferax sp. S2CR25]MDS0443679.1 NAD(+)/NADH kinase [Haloferax sp. S2CR25-2]CQR50680.1 inorganic polyphosphate/ATP-NAD kinase [Haloferax massiliensis]